MSEASLKPVIAELETLFSKFNARFFENKLESPVITVSPDHTRGAYGWCTSWKGWQNGAKEGGFYEINLCAEYLNRPYEETCGTLLHEMVHLQSLGKQGFTLVRPRPLGLKGSSKSGGSSSRKYVCPCCGTIIRATKEVHVICAECEVEFQEEI